VRFFNFFLNLIFNKKQNSALMGAFARTRPSPHGRMAASVRTQTRPRLRVCVRADILPSLDVIQRGHIKAWGWGHIKGGNSILPLSITNSKAWPHISHSCLPCLWLVEVGAINFASTVLPTCEEVRVTFML
jgi:hypothetical protein